MQSPANVDSERRLPVSVRIGFVLLCGILPALFGIVTRASAQTTFESHTSQEQFAPPPTNPGSIQNLTYVQVITGTVPIYTYLRDAVNGVLSDKSVGDGFVWLSLADPNPVHAEGQTWYKVNPNGYVSATDVLTFTPSAFHGIPVAAQPSQPFGWLIGPTRASAAPGAAPAAGAPRLARYTQVTLLGDQMVGNLKWYKIGENQWIDQRQVGVITVSRRPPGVGPGDKWIDVNLFEQTLAAYEGDRMVYATLVSSGLAYWPTPTGLFHIWLKATVSKMSGREGFPDYYYLADVPWTMYFDRSVALHGTYWHDRFGAPHSHGCVNLAPQDAEWLFNWTTPVSSPHVFTLPTATDPGTVVWVH